MNLGKIIQEFKLYQVKTATDGLMNPTDKSEYGLGVLAGKVQALEEVIQVLTKIAHDDKFEDPLA